MHPNCEIDPSNPTDSDAPPTQRTRSGRVSRPPTRYEPVEQVEDDYAPEDYDSAESDGKTDDDSFDDSDEDDDEDDADEDGNLDGFVVPDKSESDSDSTEDGGESAVPDRKRGAPVKKRPAAVGKRVAGKGGAAAK